MDNTFTLITVVTSLLGFLLPMLVPALIIGLVFRNLRPKLAAASTSMPTDDTPKRRSPWRWLGVIPLAGISLFIGLMIASIGGALNPQLTRIAAPMACSGGQLDITSSAYSYKPGQQGVAHQLTCTDPVTGERSDATYSVLGWSTLIFSAIVFVPVLVIGLLLTRFVRRTFTSIKSAWPSGGSTGPVWDLRQTFDHAIKRQQAGGHRYAGARDVEESLRELKRLRDNGLIDDADFAARKTAILSRL